MPSPAGAGGMAPPSITGISARMKCVQGHGSPVNVDGAARMFADMDLLWIAQHAITAELPPEWCLPSWAAVPFRHGGMLSFPIQEEPRRGNILKRYPSVIVTLRIV